MHAGTVLQRILRPVITRLDARNTRTLFLAVDALLLGRRLTLTELARHWPDADRIRAPLKRLDRLLGNRKVRALRAHLYAAAVGWLLRSPRPALIVDWCELKSDGRWHLLRAGVVARGRTLTVYEEVYPEAQKNSPAAEAAFLTRLKALLPHGVRPILITDAGFRVPWFRAVEALGWHWIGRVRHRTQFAWCSPHTLESRWIACKTLYAQAAHRVCSLGAVYLTRSNPLACRLVLVRRTQRGREERTRYGERARNGHTLKMIARAKEPWLLASSSSLSSLSGAEIVTLYARRMQIEQSFRDLKSHRYGCAFEDTLTRTPERLEMLLLLHALASVAAWLEGLTALAETSMPQRSHPQRCRYSAVWIGWDRLRRSSARLSAPPNASFTQVRNLLAHAAY
jgi:hypothetical protein